MTGAVALYKASRPHATPAEVKEALQYLGNLDWKTSTDPDSVHEPLLDVSRIGPLGTFAIVGRATGRRLGEAGGAVAVPVTIGRSATFFERVEPRGRRRCRRAGPPRSTTTSLFGWTANADHAPGHAPDADAAPAPTTSTVTATNQGRIADRRPSTVVVENDLPTASAAARRARRQGARSATGTAPARRRLGRRRPTRPTRSPATRSSPARRRRLVRRSSRPRARSARSDAASRSTRPTSSASGPATPPATGAPGSSTAPFRAALVDDRSASVDYTGVVGEDRLVRGHRRTRCTARRKRRASDRLHVHRPRRSRSSRRSARAAARSASTIDGVYQATVDLRRAGDAPPPDRLHEDVRQQRHAHDHARDRARAAGSSSTGSSSSSRRRSARLQRA